MVNLRSNRLAIPAWSAILASALGTLLMFASSMALAGVVPLRANIVVASMLLAAPSLMALVVYRVPLAAGLAVEGIARRISWLALAAGLGFWVASLGLIELQYALWPPAEGYLEGFRRLHEALRPANAVDALWSAIAIAVAPALFEETTVRGVLLPSLRPWLGDAFAIAGSALVFAAMHADPYRFAFTLAVGGALGLLRVRTGSLWPSVIAHGTLNLLTFAAAPWLDDPTEPLPDPRPWLGAGLFALGVAVSFVVVRAMGRALTASETAPRLPS